MKRFMQIILLTSCILLSACSGLQSGGSSMESTETVSEESTANLSDESDFSEEAARFTTIPTQIDTGATKLLHWLSDIQLLITVETKDNEIQLYIFDMDTKSIRLVYTLEEPYISKSGIASDDNQLIIPCIPNIYIFSLPDFELQNTILQEENSLRNINYTVDGFKTYEGIQSYLDPDFQLPIINNRINSHGIGPFNGQWSPDGRYLSYSTGYREYKTSSLFVADRTGQPVFDFEWPDSNGSSIYYSWATSSRYLLTYMGATMRVYDVEQRDIISEFTLADFGNSPFDNFHVRDLHNIGYLHETTIMIYRLEERPGHEERVRVYYLLNTLTGEYTEVDCPKGDFEFAFAPDGNHLIYIPGCPTEIFVYELPKPMQSPNRAESGKPVEDTSITDPAGIAVAKPELSGEEIRALGKLYSANPYIQYAARSGLHFQYKTGSVVTKTVPSPMQPDDQTLIDNAYVTDSMTAFVSRSVAEPATITLMMSRDGAETWDSTTIDLEGLKSTYAFIQFLDAKQGYLLVSGQLDNGDSVSRLYGSVDGGLTWNSISDIEFPNSTETEFAFATPDIGIALSGADALFRTVDGGKTWHNIAPSLDVLAETMLITDYHVYSFEDAELPRFQGNYGVMGIRYMPYWERGLDPERIIRSAPPGPEQIIYLATTDSGMTWFPWLSPPMLALKPMEVEDERWPLHGSAAPKDIEIADCQYDPDTGLAVFDALGIQCTIPNEVMGKIEILFEDESSRSMKSLWFCYKGEPQHTMFVLTVRNASDFDDLPAMGPLPSAIAFSEDGETMATHLDSFFMVTAYEIAPDGKTHLPIQEVFDIIDTYEKQIVNSVEFIR